ncbi:MAG TPA: hypothetical protein VFA26_18805 [Gemmataceae bacterium]|nr:hypothetical protein [Gemmataceae bacterium]
MGSADQSTPTPPVNVQAEPPPPPAEAATISLPPPSAAKSPGAQGSPDLARILDGALAALVLALAAFVASFAARNSDLWMHLASGRLLAQGRYAFGADPFSYTTQGVYWANHAWLYDLGLYGLYSLAGGTALVIAKAVAVVALAALMLTVRRPGQGLLFPAVGTALALLALHPRLLLQPTVLSFLFLGGTLWLLQRPRAEEGGRAGFLGSPRRLWLLVPLFALWVNVDVWFLLGPLAVALWLVGTLLQQKVGPPPVAADAPAPGEVKTLALALAAGLAACLLNPHHYHAFTLPEQLPFLSPAALRTDPLLRYMFVSPLQGGYYQYGLAYSTAGVAYFALAVLGLGSFALNWSRWHWGRALVWLALLGLSAYHARAIPFFAVAAGPVAALNFQDCLARRFAEAPKLRACWPLPQAAACVAGVVLLALAWPGWLFGQPHDHHRVAWRLEPDASLEKAARLMAEAPDGGRWLNLQPDLANYMAWHCPGQKSFFDYRLQLFLANGAADDWVEVRRKMGAERETRADQDDWQGVLRRRETNRVVTAGELPRLERLLGDPAGQWVLLRPAGRAALLGWVDPRAPGRAFESERFDPDRAAFGPKGEAAPASGPESIPEPPTGWDVYLQAPAPRPAAADEANLHLLYFQARGPAHFQSAVAAWSTGALIGEAAPAGGPTALGLRLALGVNPVNPPGGLLGRAYVANLGASLDGGPAASLLLALREGRRAVAANPASADAWLGLGLTYTMLPSQTREGRWAAGIPLLNQLRQAQRAAALHTAVRLQPDNARAQAALARMYAELRFDDLALKHFTEAARLEREQGRPAGESPEHYEERLEQLRKVQEKLQADLRKAQDEFALAREGKRKVLDKALLALDKGLQGQALELLAQSDEVRSDPAVIHLTLDLLAKTGRLNDLLGGVANLKGDGPPLLIGPGGMVVPKFSREAQSLPLGGALEVPSYEWFRLLAAAAAGNYRDADAVLERTLGHQDGRAREELAGLVLRTLGHSSFFALSWAGGPQPEPLASYLLQAFLRASTAQALRSFPTGADRRADLQTIRGLLALEMGDNARAARLFRNALQLTAGPGGDPHGRRFAGRPLAVRYLDALERAGW